MQELSSGAAPERKFSVIQSANAPLEREVDELRTKLQEVEKRSAREIKALNQEVCLSFAHSLLRWQYVD